MRVLKAVARTVCFTAAASAALLLFFGCAHQGQRTDTRRRADARARESSRAGSDIPVRLLIAENSSVLTARTGYAWVQGKGVDFALQPSMVVISPEGVDTPSGMANLPVTIRSDEPIVINGREYYGHMVVTGEYLVNVVPLELYLHGVIASEMSHSWPLEALKAQAVASRTFACRKLLLSRNDPYDLRDTEMDQKYLLSQAHPALDRAVQGTHGQILMYGGEPIEAFFHSCSGGRTEASGDVFQADLPYLRSIPDPVCREERFEWSCTLRLDEITSALGLQPGVKQVRAGEKTSSGRVKEFELLLENGSETTVAGNRFRLAVGPTRLRSLLILDMAAGSDSGRPAIVFRGRGYGHGVGMSQWGARAMAESGRGYRTILGHYYRGVRIGMVWDIL